MVNFSPLTTEIFWRVWGTPANFNGFIVLALLLQRRRCNGGQPNFARCLAVYWAGTLYIHFRGSCHLTDFCQMQNSHSVQVLRSPIGTVTARHWSSGHRLNFAACDKERNYGTFAPRWRPSRWASAHILVFCSCGFYLSSFLFSSPILSGWKLGVGHTSTCAYWHRRYCTALEQ